MESVKKSYQRLSDKFSHLSSRFSRKSSQLSMLRLLWFICWMLCIYASTYYNIFFVSSAVVGGLMIFVVLIIWHNKIIKKKNIYEIKRDINRNEIKALEYDSSVFDDGYEFMDESHRYSHDLDLFGPFSLFQFLNRCFSPQGKKTLASRLKEGYIEKETIESQQEAVEELSQKNQWLQEFRVLGVLAVSGRKKNTSPIADLGVWGKRSSIFSARIYIILVLLIGFLSFLMILLLITGKLGFNHFVVYLFLPLGISAYFTKKINSTHMELGKQSDALQRWKSIFYLMENENFNSICLQKLKSELNKADTVASIAIKKLYKISQAFDTRLNLFGWFILNYFFLWDILQSIRLENWRKKYGHHLDNWFGVLFEIEALVSLATFRYNHPHSIFPKIVEGDFIYRAKNAAHPLIEREKCVPNPVEFSSLGSFNIVTGANMAGKSTYLRTVGVNLILSKAGSALLADELIIKPIKLFTSIRTKDNLARNESYFYAELLRLQSIMEELKSGEPLFVILDEILKGTNSKDKESGSKALISRLIGLKAVGLIATHDLQLGTLVKIFPDKIKNYCFEVDIKKDELSFDYKLRQGISKNLNATFLMKKMGITNINEASTK
jgi:hypothetical protein